jgi:ATP-dependent 26S proteasome regulatory subunit
MSRTQERFAAEMERLRAVGEGAPSMDEKCQVLQRLRAESPEMALRTDWMLVEEADRMRQGLQQARNNLHDMKQILDRMTSSPWHAGIYLRAVDDPGILESLLFAESDPGDRVMVYQGGSVRVVQLAEGLDAGDFQLGDEVLLNQELTLVLGRSPEGGRRVGETAAFERYTDDRRLVLRWREEQLLVDAAAALGQIELAAGDLVRLDRAACVAYEKIERSEGRSYFIGKPPEGRLEQVGGQRQNLRALLAILQTRLLEPETAALYALNGRHAPVMVGPPGCGKTLIARVVCAEIARTRGAQCRFAVVKPAEWFDPYVGVTEQNIRATFRGLGEAAKEFGMAVLFLDEIESVGRMRGSMTGQHSDRFLDALLAEMDGFENRGDVAIMGATNRKDLCDPALLERFDEEVAVGRPDMRGAREIFAIHLPASVPFSPNGDAAMSTREQLIDRAVSHLYSPNADNQLSLIKFRDGKTRNVTAGDLMSGRAIEQICRAARQAGFLRDVRSKDRGIRVEDIDEAVSQAIERLSTALTPRNAHAYLSDLPQDVDVVAVEPVRRPAARSHRYVNNRENWG